MECGPKGCWGTKIHKWLKLRSYKLHCVRSELVTNTIDQTYRVASLMFDVLDRRSSLLSSLALHKRCSPDISGVKKALYLSPKLSLLHSKQTRQQQTSTFVYIAYLMYVSMNMVLIQNEVIYPYQYSTMHPTWYFSKYQHNMSIVWISIA